MRQRLVVLSAILALAGPAAALNKQGARAADSTDDPVVGLTGYLFLGGFLFNPTYAARPNNTGSAALRYGLHADLDLYHKWLTVSYDENTFTDGAAESSGVLKPSEHDHIIGLLTSIRLPRHLALSLAVHYEIDVPGAEPNGAYRALHADRTGPNRPPGCYLAGYSQQYVDVYARLSWERGPFTVYGAIGGFVYNPTYAARPDNAGLALLRYVLHGEYRPTSWLALRLDLNFFTDRDELVIQPTELDVTSEVALRWRAFELRFVGEADLPIGSYPTGGPNPASPVPGLKQVYLSALLQWSFDVGAWLQR